MSPIQAAMGVINQDLRPVIPEFVPPAFAALIRSCWSRDPKQRPTFPQLLERLAHIRQQGLPRLELSAKNAKLYRKKILVYAFRSSDPVTVFKSWGTGESKPGDWVIVGPGDDVYTCDAKIFMSTYRPEPNKPFVYRKIGKIWARKMEHAFLVETLEGMEHGEANDYLAQNPVDGEQWPIDAATFDKTYEVAPVQKIHEDDDHKFPEEKKKEEDDMYD
eukprot:TRINITY_DN9101_c0_g2_i1.p1 TRINITY_DN9101_c0_g2~~TRINITY_DN9101_c0_g2_i1.p1  ORF type:complete len:218 (-),score=86.10 TRINITY_DN9101_c0_g2_i1:67-720(-)